MRLFLLALALAGTVAGCSKVVQSERPRPTYDAQGIAQAALSSYDKNKNGQIDGAELDACPGLRAALPALDKNKDRSLSASEIKERVEYYAALGEVNLTITVNLDDRPLAGATITVEPEPFMGTSLKTATATTDKDGSAGLFLMDGGSFVSLPAGLYRIRVTKEGMNIPARFNTQTTLGREVVLAPRQGEVAIDLVLRSR
jgi:uncharacterized protein YceK